MKKSIIVLFLLLVVLCGATGAFAQSESDFKVTTTRGKVTIIGYTGKAAAVVIPATIGGLPVVAIDDEAFARYTGLTSVSIPENVTSISQTAFMGCTGLASISVDTRNASYISRNSVLFNKTEDTLIRCPAGIKAKQYAVPAVVTTIGSRAFEDCASLTVISISESVTNFKNNAFSGCIGLTAVSISTSVTNIGNNAFRGCTALTSIQVDANNKNYSSRNGVLFNKTVDKLIAYPAGRNEKHYDIPASVTDMGSSAFEGCTGLTSVSIPASVSEIRGNAFYGCTGLASIQVDANNENYSSRDGVLFNKEGDRLITYPAGLNGQYAVPASVTVIEGGAFSGCTGLTSINIPVSTTAIGTGAFYGCTNLTAIRIGANVSLGYAGREAFVNGFDGHGGYYGVNDRKAGVYTFHNGAWSYAAR